MSITEFPTEPTPFWSDLLRGAAAIAEFLFGHVRHRRKVFRLNETSRMPYFYNGSMVCARKSTLLSWIKEQEQRGPGGKKPGKPDTRNGSDPDDGPEAGK